MACGCRKFANEPPRKRTSTILYEVVLGSEIEPFDTLAEAKQYAADHGGVIRSRAVSLA